MAGHYLSIKKWKPYFVPQNVKVTYSAVWVRLPHLPTEFYDAILLTKVGNAIEKLLKVDACTSSTLRGRYARLCVQISMEEPVLSSIQIGHHNQTILYEGDGYLCTSCGRFGHIRLRCLYQKLTPPMAPSNQGTALAPSDHEEWHTVKFPSRKNGKGGRNTPLPTKTQFPTKARVATEHTEAKVNSTYEETPGTCPASNFKFKSANTISSNMSSFDNNKSPNFFKSYENTLLKPRFLPPRKVFFPWIPIPVQQGQFVIVKF